MTYANPNIPIPSNPVFVDAKIAEIQTALGGLSWLTNSFGRSYLGEMQRGKEKAFKAPFVYKGSGEYYPVEFNDNLQAQSFFEVGDQVPSTDWEPRALNGFNVELGIIFWVNLKKIDGTKGSDYYFSEELKKDVRDLFRTNFGLDCIIERISEDTDDIWSKYSFKQSSDKQYFLYPYCSFKFTVNLQIWERC